VVRLWTAGDNVTVSPQPPPHSGTPEARVSSQPITALRSTLEEKAAYYLLVLPAYHLLVLPAYYLLVLLGYYLLVLPGYYLLVLLGYYLLVLPGSTTRILPTSTTQVASQEYINHVAAYYEATNSSSSFYYFVNIGDVVQFDGGE